MKYVFTVPLGSEREAQDAAREQERMPRAREVADRIQRLLDAIPGPDLTAAEVFRKARLEGFQLAIAFYIGQGEEISSELHAEFLEQLG